MSANNKTYFIQADSGQVSIDLNLDAAGRLRISELTTLIDLKQLSDKLPLFFDDVTIGGGLSTYSVGNSATSMEVFNNNDAVIRQTYRRFNYQSGKSYLVFNTFDRFEPQTDVIKRVGYFNTNIVTPYDSDKDGVYLESSDVVYIVIEKTGSIVSKIAQSAWNVDKLDGTGPSGITVDWSKGQVFVFDLLWLGKAGVRFYLEISNKLILFHLENFANVRESVYISSPNHSIRYEIRSTGGAGKISHVCSSVNIEGARNNLGAILGFNVGEIGLNFMSGGTNYMALALRLKANHVDTSLDILVFSILGTTPDNFLWELLLNPTVTGLVDGDFSSEIGEAVEIATGGTSRPITDKGNIIDNGYVSQKDQSRNTIENAIRLGMSISGLRDVFVLSITPLSNNLTVFPAITIREVI